MPQEDYDAIAKRTNPVPVRPTLGSSKRYIWEYAEWLETCAGRYLWQLEERTKDMHKANGANERSHARWIAAYSRNKETAAILVELAERLVQPLDAEKVEGVNDATA